MSGTVPKKARQATKRKLEESEEYQPPRDERKEPPLTKEDIEAQKKAIKQYGRGEKINTKAVRDIKLRGNLKKLEYRYKDTALKAKDAELLLQEEIGTLEAEGMEKTFRFTQKQIAESVDIATSQKSFQLKLPTFGPYEIDYTRTGKHLLIGGRKGHVAAFDWREGKLYSELNLNETIRDVKWLHNESFFAVAQKKYAYIYDTQGVEIHCLKKHIEVTHMEFLPYHFLLATVGNAGWLKYQDTSTGQLVAEIRTKKGIPQSMTQNKYNAVIHIGHGDGVVSLWTPNMGTPAVQIRVHRGPVRALAIDREGRYMASGGQDCQLCIFDIRTFKPVHKYYTPTPPTSLDISDTGLVAVGWGPHVTIWKDAFRTKQKVPYLVQHSPASAVNDVRFCPFEDILGFGHEQGIASLIVPGAGEANFDAMEVNPYETKAERQENEIKSLLNKLQPGMIALNPDIIGRIDAASDEVKKKEREDDKKPEKYESPKNKARGKSSASKRYLRKMKKRNIIDQKKLAFEQMKEEKRRERAGLPSEVDQLGPALARFVRPPARF